MKLCNLMIAGIGAGSAAMVAQATEVFDRKGSEIVDMVNYFKQNLHQYTWLYEPYKDLFSNLPSNLEFRRKWTNYQLVMKFVEPIDNKKLKIITNKSKNFFRKYLGQNNILCNIACKVIDMGYYEEGIDVYDVNDSEMFLDFDYLNNIRNIKYKARGNYESKNTMRKESRKKLCNILQNYISDYTYRQEKAEKIDLANKPREYEWELYKRYKNKLRNFASNNFSPNFFDDIILPKMKKNYSYDLYQEILNETRNKYCILHKSHKNEFEEIWCKCRQNFCETHRIHVKYHGDAHLLSTTIHETGHTIADAITLLMDGKHARLENIEAIAMYFETLLYGDEAYKSYDYVKIDRLYTLYADLASIISVGILRNNFGDVNPIVGIKALSPKERIARVSENRELCLQAIETYNLVAQHIDTEIESVKIGRTNGICFDNEKIADELEQIYEQFYIDHGNIRFEFSDHTKALFHAHRLIKQGSQQISGCEQVLYELACEKMRIPFNHEFKDVVSKLYS